ncbi:MAG TPA: UrcA family protein [Steroidobacteraceae bacterium]|nr:UrcA family protein [Steroidobacteraceae bacterium]
MNVQEKIPHRSNLDSDFGTLALLGLCGLLLSVAIGTSMPAEAATEKSATVRIADLDLSTDKGMQAARDRIHDTARKLCNQLINPWSISHEPDFVQCVNEATTGAVAQLHGPIQVANAR